MKIEDQIYLHITFKRKKIERKRRNVKKKSSKVIFDFLLDHFFLSSVHHLCSCKILADHISLVLSTNCYLAFDIFITIFRINYVEFILELFYLVGNTILYSIP